MPDLLDELAVTAERLARGAADLLVDGLRRQRTRVGTKSSSTDMVTEMDRASEDLIVDALRTSRPSDGVLGEEGSAAAGSSGVRWLIDPIDGTTNYLYGHPGFAVSIAAEVDGRVDICVVVDPLHVDVFRAVRGRGASRNGEPLTLRDPVARGPAAAGLGTLGDALVATGFAYDPARRERQAEVLARVIGRVRDIRRVGAASVDLCWVGTGRVDAYYERGLSPWDLAAGSLVAEEAGAFVGDLDGGPPSPQFVLAAHPDLFEPLRLLLTAAGANDA
jgi:myo-inositol-1(or 4)-monophosphatase